MNKKEMESVKNELKNREAREVLAWTLEKFGVTHAAFSSSLGAEDQVVTDMLMQINPASRIFTLDTGRLPEETYRLIERTNEKYHIKIEMLFPETASVEKMEREYGPNLFYENIEQRKLCCQVRKVEPLKRKLKTLEAWITGLRKEQSVTRTALQVLEWDEFFGLFKINPLWNWSEKQVWNYIKKNEVPYSTLHDQGYPSIGCAPCTRAISPGEELRAGRWWWEKAEKKECGLHLKNGKP